MGDLNAQYHAWRAARDDQPGTALYMITSQCDLVPVNTAESASFVLNQNSANDLDLVLRFQNESLSMRFVFVLLTIQNCVVLFRVSGYAYFYFLS